MADALMFAGLTVAVMTFVGIGVHFGERWVDKHFELPPAPSEEWRKAVDSIVKKCTLASTLHMSTTFNADGSKALADLLTTMAKKLDRVP